MCFSVCGNPALGHTITISSANIRTPRLQTCANIMVSLAKYIVGVAGARSGDMSVCMPPKGEKRHEKAPKARNSAGGNTQKDLALAQNSGNDPKHHGRVGKCVCGQDVSEFLKRQVGYVPGMADGIVKTTNIHLVVTTRERARAKLASKGSFYG